MLLGIICACTCGVKTECGNHAQISLLTSIHDDPSCRKLSARGVLLYEAAKLLAELHNNKSAGYDIGKPDILSSLNAHFPPSTIPRSMLPYVIRPEGRRRTLRLSTNFDLL